MAESSQSRNPLVKWAVPREAAKLPETFTTQAPFRVFNNTYIVGVVAGNLAEASQNKDGWFQSDFYALNYLLKGAGKSQTWLTSADPRLLLKKYGRYLHGNPQRERRVVLSHELLDAQEISPVEVHQASKITDRFLQAVSEASTLAKENDGNLLILAFCHGTFRPEETGERGGRKDVQRLFLGGGSGNGTSFNQVKGAIDHGVKTTLISTACYAGGWLIEPDFNYTALMASGDPKMESRAWQDSKSVGRACGSAFASAVMDALCGTQPPQHQDAARPEADKETVTLSYNQLCRSVLEVCGRTLFEGKDHFSFSAQNDGWEESWPDNTGIPLTQFKSRWEALEIAHIAVEPPSDSSVPDMVCATGSLQLKNKGTENPQHPSAASSAESLNPRLTLAIDRFLEITPASSYIPGGPRIKGFLKDCALSGDPVEETPEDDPVPISNLMNAWHVMSFRTEFAALLTYIVDRVGLPRPSNKRALEFDHDEWWEKHLAGDANFFGPEYKEFSTRFGVAIYAHLDSYGTMVQGGRFTAMARYIDSSIFEYFRSDANLTIDDAGQKWQEFQDLLQEIGRSIVERAKQDENLKQKGERYRVSVGKA